MLDTDTCDHSIVVFLSQVHDGHKRVIIAYKCKKNYLHTLTATHSAKNSKNHRKVILLSSTLTLRRCDDACLLELLGEFDYIVQC